MICLAEAIAKAHGDLKGWTGTNQYVTVADPLPDLISVVLHFRFPELIWNGPGPQGEPDDSPPLTPLTSPEPPMDDDEFSCARCNGDIYFDYPNEVCPF